MPLNLLSESKVKKLTEAGIYRDGGGLFLRVRDTGTRSWVFIWRRKDAKTGKIKRNERGLGGYDSGTAPVSLAHAREKAAELREKLARGQSVKDETTTFKQVMDVVIEYKTAGLKGEASKAQWGLSLREYAKNLHTLALSEITTADVVACLTPIWIETPETADRTRSRISAVWQHGKANGQATGDDPADKKTIEILMPKRVKRIVKNHAALAYQNAPQTIAKLRKSKGTAARATEFVALSAVRFSEAVNAPFTEFDMEARLWTIPAERMKAGIEHVVPLTPRMVEIIEERRAIATSDFVFEGGKEGQPVTGTAMAKALRLASGDKEATIHGLRSAFRDWAGNETHHAREIAEEALAHLVGNKVERAYRRSSAMDKRRALMMDWHKYLTGK
ncbi:tyrosine-type recombinase/integrase [Agrobacterium fabrum]|uniref:tyrosine-type recombinase/integrase n=1 Tax=Agrobacterium fabrum TaxID=1176649 RepID=UPI002158758C|nr:site-specific integrase [Agrobacterium fabrum]MCR6722796.1 integrase arm-type DNA-binding domain-containing protein [Agrobacterium fabrum]